MNYNKKEADDKTMLELILSNRSFLMGVAMIMVIVYHLFCWVYNPIGIFNIGYIGVDVFLFLSGLGLSYSYEKNSIVHFYKNRIKRIYPIYLLSVLATYIIFKLNWSTFDLFANIFTIGLYTKSGEYRYDWYLESLFSLYILFPIIYNYGKTKMIGVAIVLVFITIFLYYYNVSWWYECILGRLPIFIYGVIFKEQAKSYKITCIIGLLFFLPCFRSISPFLAVSGLTIPLIIFSLKLINITPNKLYGLISYVGVHSLEFYLANLFVYWTYESGCYTLKERLVIFISIQTIATAFLIITNKILYIAK